jgi:hypothetical protein
MKLFPFLVLIPALILAPCGGALAGTVTGQVTFIGPDGEILILNRRDAYLVGPNVSLAAVSVRQTITAEVTDGNGTRTIIRLLVPAAPAKQPTKAVPARP